MQGNPMEEAEVGKSRPPEEAAPADRCDRRTAASKLRPQQILTLEKKYVDFIRIIVQSCPCFALGVIFSSPVNCSANHQ